MKATFFCKTLLTLLSKVSHAVSSKHQLPVYECIRIEKKGGSLYATACDGNLQITSRADDDHQNSGDFCFLSPGSKLINILKLYPGNDLVVKINYDPERSKVKLVIGKNRYTLSSLPDSDLPLSEVNTKESPSFSVKGSVFSNLLSRTAYATSNNDHRMWMNGVNIYFRNSILTAAACNGHVLALSGDESFKKDSDSSFILPMKALNCFMSICSNDDTYDVYIGHQVTFTSNDLTVMSTLIDAKFGDTERIIPKPKNHVQCKTADLLNAVKRVSLLASQKDSYQRVAIECSENGITLSVNNPNDDGGSAEDVIDGRCTGSPKTTGVSANYLKNTLAVIDDEEVIVSFDDDVTPLLIHGAGNSVDSQTHIIMPMRA
jgi:DNA polymerase-3 subunit beta